MESAGADHPSKPPTLLLGVNVNLQYASIPKRDRPLMVGCFESLLDAAEEASIRLTVFFTGVSAEWLAEFRPDVVSRVRSLVDAGRVEVGSHTYAHAVLTLLPQPDQVWQIQWGEKAVKTVFGQEAKGLFVPEFGFHARTAHYLAEGGGTKYVIGPQGRRSLEAFRMEGLDNELLILRPGWRASQRLKSSLMGVSSPPTLSLKRSYCIVADSEYPYFAADTFDSMAWRRSLKALTRGHQTQLMAPYLSRANLPLRSYKPAVPTKHRTWFRGIREIDEKLNALRKAAMHSGQDDLIRALLLAENSDGYECLTQRYAGHGWDEDIRSALNKGLRLSSMTAPSALSAS